MFAGGIIKFHQTVRGVEGFGDLDAFLDLREGQSGFPFFSPSCDVPQLLCGRLQNRIIDVSDKDAFIMIYLYFVWVSALKFEYLDPYFKNY